MNACSPAFRESNTNMLSNTEVRHARSDRRSTGYLHAVRSHDEVHPRAVLGRELRGVVDERAAEDCSNEAPSLSPMEACMQASLFAGEFACVEEKHKPEQDEHDAGEARFMARKNLDGIDWEIMNNEDHSSITPRALAAGLRSVHRIRPGVHVEELKKATSEMLQDFASSRRGTR